MFGIMADEFAVLADRMCAATRAENQAAGARLVAISELDLLVLRRYGERETWSTDTQAAISAEIAAALRISRHWAASYLYYARALRIRLPKVGALLCAGDISYPTFQTIVYRTDLITDLEVLANIDATLAARATRWPALTRGRLASYVDKVVAKADRDAIRRRREQHAGREFSIWGDRDGVTEVFGRLISTDAHVLDARLDAMAATVCAEDPRTHQQRRADALGALAAGAVRLACRCEHPESVGPTKSAAKPVVIHVIAEQASLDGTGSNPASLIGDDALIPVELLPELARSAQLRPLPHPTDAPPEEGYTPSRALADFVRCRDLTCRFPGCSEPATRCDLDHTTPYADGGPTHASNLKAICRKDHLLKTFWGWKDQQLADGTLIWTSPTGQTYISTPGSALLFPQLCVPTGELAKPAAPLADRCTDRTAMMPKRKHTRAANHARYIATERRQNQKAREARHATQTPSLTPINYTYDDPPPF